MAAKNEQFEKEFDRALKKYRKDGQRPTLEMMEKVAMDVSRRMASNAVKEKHDTIAQKVGDFKQSVAQSLRGISQSQKDGTSLILPPNCRYAIKTNDTFLYVIEQEPQVRTLILDRGYDRAGIPRKLQRGAAARVALPYVVFCIFSSHINNNRRKQKNVPLNVACSFRNAPLKSLDDNVCQPYFPNLYSNNVICLGRSPHSRMTPKETVEYGLQLFYNTAFTGEAQHWGDAYMGSAPSAKVKDWRTWEENSIKNPLFALKVKWKKPVKLSALLQRLVPNQVLDANFNRDVNTALRALTKGIA